MTTAGSAKIVCATDFSPNATAALRWAATTAAAPGDSIDLVNVVSPPSNSFVELTMDAGTLDAARTQATTERLGELARATEREFGISVTPYVLTGQPPRAIAEHADSAKARLLVLGARARSFLDRPILGSVAERTVRIYGGPVAVVPQLDDAGLAHAQPLRVLVGLEGGAVGERALELVGSLRRTRPCDVTLLHLYWPIAEYQRLGLQGSRDLFAGDPDVIRNLEPELRQRIGVLPGQGAVELSIRPAWGDPAANLLAAADEGDYQILVVGAERRHGLARFWHPSVSQRLVRHATGAVVICVPSPAVAPTRSLAETPPRLWSVLAPTDLSAAGNAAIPHAYALLAGHGGVVELCHIHQRALPNPPYAYERSADRLSPEAVAELERQLRALVPPYAERLGVTTHVSIIEGGAPAEAIVQASERLAVDAISLGSRGGGASVVRALMGSVAQRVVQTSHKPVLVIPPPRELH